MSEYLTKRRRRMRFALGAVAAVVLLGGLLRWLAAVLP
jgi:hypothetical protein